MTNQPFTGRIGIVGAGALGAFYGARLARAGHDIHLLLRSDYDAVKQDGIHVTSFEGDFHVSPPVYDTPESLGPCDLIIVGLKTTSNAALATLLPTACHENTLVLTLQNGLGNEDAIARALGPGSETRVLGGISFLCSNRTAPGHIHHIDHGQIRMSEFAAPVSQRTHAIAALFTTAGIRCDVYDNLLRARWEKLVWNIPFNGLGVAARANVAQVLASPDLHELAHQLMLEAVAAAEATGTPMDHTMPAKMMKNSQTMGPYKSSMQLDHEAHRPLEVEAIIGEPVRRAQAAGLQVPRMDMLAKLIRAADAASGTDK